MKQGFWAMPEISDYITLYKQWYVVTNLNLYLQEAVPVYPCPQCWDTG